MNLFEILLVSISLAIDAFAVSVCKGLSLKKVKISDALNIGLWFGIFQAIMPILGFLLGNLFFFVIYKIDHFISFILLAIIGINMFKDEQENIDDDLSPKTMTILAISTSIDAFSIGIAYYFAYASKNAILTFFLIGIVAFIMCFIGFLLGNKFGNHISNANKVAGIILILLGVKILIEHLFYM